MRGENLSHALQRKTLADRPKIQHTPGFEACDEWPVLIERNDPAHRSRESRTRLHRIDHRASTGIESTACGSRSLDGQPQAPVTLITEEECFSRLHRIDAADVATGHIAAQQVLDLFEFLERRRDSRLHSGRCLHDINPEGCLHRISHMNPHCGICKNRMRRSGCGFSVLGHGAACSSL